MYTLTFTNTTREPYGSFIDPPIGELLASISVGMQDIRPGQYYAEMLVDDVVVARSSPAIRGKTVDSITEMEFWFDPPLKAVASGYGIRYERIYQGCVYKNTVTKIAER